eukprot:TRINITY_DN2163_c0_g4_i1.p1 TRINITY_DN2163_c0_g4~~TRINITY_DN2163_c0_g4_i1.p1  ORF type:complete len:364 (-),score=44.42 TRINITY_DN2163_c0_g4_i1:174-1265(-)
MRPSSFLFAHKALSLSLSLVFMAPRRTHLRDLLNLIKDKASISKAALLSTPHTSSLHLSLLRATTHHPTHYPLEEHVTTLLSSGQSSRNTASSLIKALMDRLHNTHNSSVALKCLIIVHMIIRRGTFILQDQLSIYPYTGGRNYLNLSNFRDDSNPQSWALSSCVRWYARLLEQILHSSKLLGFFLCNRREDGAEEKVSGLLNGDLLKEVEVLVGIVQEVCNSPELSCFGENRLVRGVLRLVDEDNMVTQKEILVRVEEIRERLVSCVSYGDSVELVCVLKRLESCRERVGDLLMGLVGEVKERAVLVREFGGDEKLERFGRRLRWSESDRFGERVVSSGDSVRFSSGRMVLVHLRRSISEMG